MEVILKQDLKNLGYKDDVVKVRNGYGRNFLIPQGIAIQATESSKKVLTETIKQRAFKEQKIKAEAQKMSDSLQNLTLTIGAKVGDTGKIFGSVNTLQIAEALKAKGFNIDRKQIHIEDEHIKSTGSYEATINLHKELKIKLNFEVVAE